MKATLLSFVFSFFPEFESLYAKYATIRRPEYPLLAGRPYSAGAA
jgi:hypothetical protein